jgi:hypothetical protein
MTTPRLRIRLLLRLVVSTNAALVVSIACFGVMVFGYDAGLDYAVLFYITSVRYGRW